MYKSNIGGRVAHSYCISEDIRMWLYFAHKFINLRLFILGLFAGQAQWFDGLAKSLGYESVYHHAVIIDAGSSGSRVLAYKLRVPFTGKLGMYFVIFI